MRRILRLALSFCMFSACGPETAIKVDGEKVSLPEWEALQLHYKMQNDESKKRFVTELVNATLLAKEAERLDLDEEPLTAALIDQQQRQLLAGAYRDHVAARIKDEDVKAHYQANISDYTRVLYELHQIVARYAEGDAAAEKRAQERIDRAYASLRSGVDFKVVAATQTDDLSARANGGAVGKVSIVDVPEELRAVVRQLEPGRFSTPVKSRFGLHILYVEGETERVVQPYDRVASKLRGELIQKKMQEEVSRLRSKAKIKSP